MRDHLLPIGAFSRASSISVRTLRNYHESGLLVPASVDPATGYRSYTVDQLADALVIVRLRDLDVPLPSVHRVLTARDPELTRAVLAEHERTMRARLADAERIIATLQQGMPSSGTPAHRLTTAAEHTVQRTATVAGEGLWPWLEASAAMLFDAAGEHAATTESVSALYTPALEDEQAEHVTVFLPIDEPFLLAGSPELTIGELPATEWAVLTHTGGFATVGETYRLLGAWVARNASPLPHRICERYPMLGRSDDAGDAVIELRWPVATS